jgi:transcriptional regulator GlxA family with amidase domain
MPMDELSGQLVDMHDVLGDAGTGLGDKVRSMATWQERFDEIDRFLLRRAANGPRVVAPEVAHVWRRLVSSGGAVPIRSLSREVGWSHKHLITRFTQQLGFAPKRAARLVRFERVLGRLNDGTPVDWGQVAADFGYADQAHLIRDFGEFGGVSPSAYLACRRSQREVNSVQDDLADVS